MTQKKRLVVLTGAGMSAESGLSTFRSSDGLWENHRVEDVASIEGFIRNPQLVLDFYAQRRRDAFAAEPNMGHRILADLEREYEVYIITQNVDDLHERAGSSHVLHLHGELRLNCSTLNRQTTYPVTEDSIALKVGDLAPDGSQMRPFIVWFGEEVPLFETAVHLVEQADIFVVVGTSLAVYPAAGLLSYVPSSTPIYLIDPAEVSSPYRPYQWISQGASSGLETLCNKLKALQ